MVPLNPARAGIPFTYGRFQPTFRTLALNVCGLPAQAHNPSQTTRTAFCAPGHHHILRNHTIDTLQISNLYYNSIYGLLGCFAGQHTTTLYFLQSMSDLAKSTRQTPTMIREVATATSDHCLWPLSKTHKPNYHNLIYIQQRPIATHNLNETKKAPFRLHKPRGIHEPGPW